MSAETDDTTAPNAQEVWKAIPSLKNLYEASSLGRIRSVPRSTTTGVVLRFSQNRQGRYLVTPSVDGNISTKQVSRLVCEAFHGPCPPDKDLVAHWDGDHLNNRPENLRWATYFENEEDKRRHDRHAVGERNPSAKLTKAQAEAILREKGSLNDVAEKYGVSPSLVFMIRKGQVWNDEGNAIRRKRRAALFSIRHRAPKRAYQHARSTMTWDLVRDIRGRYALGETQTAIARSIGVRQGTIHLIVTGKTWKEAHHLDLSYGPLCCCRT